MIKKIKVKNFQAIGEATIDFTESRIDYRTNMVNKWQIVNPSVFYGTNASGKTCFLNVLQTLSNLVNGDGVDFIPNLYTHPKQASELEVFFMINEVNYYYKITAWGHFIANESLIVDNVEYLSQNNTAYKTSQIKNCRFVPLSNDVKKARAFFKTIKYIDLEAPLNTYVNDLERHNKSVTNFINEITGNNYSAFRFPKALDGQRHVTYYDDDKFLLELDFERNMSHGLKRLYHLVSVLFATKNNHEMVIVVDDLDFGIHPTILIKLMQTLNADFNAQIICSMHNTALMKYLRPDQIYFVTNYNHTAVIDRLNEAMPKLREIHNIEKLYYGGRIPVRINAKHKDLT